MNLKTIFITIIGVLICIYLYSIFNNSNSDEEHINELLTQAEELRKELKEQIDETLLNQIFQELDKAFVPISAYKKFYKQVTEIRYLNLLILEINDNLIDGTPFKAEQRLGLLNSYLENNKNHPRYDYYQKQANQLQSSIDRMGNSYDKNNKSMHSYLKIWLEHYHKDEGHFPLNLIEFKGFIRNYSLSISSSILFESYYLSDNNLEISYADKNINKQYTIEYNF